MGTKKVLLDAGLNAAIWDKGIKNVPHRIRVRLQRESPFSSWTGGARTSRAQRSRGASVLTSCVYVGRRNDDEDAKDDEKLYTYASFVPVKAGGFKVRSCLRAPLTQIRGSHTLLRLTGPPDRGC